MTAMKCDCHIHMVLDGAWYKTALARHEKAPEEAFVREILATYRDLGYAYLRDGGDRLGASALAQRLSPEYGIRYRTPLAPISKKGHYGGFIGIQFENLKEYAALVKAHKGDFVKIMISGLMDFNVAGRLTEEGLSEEEIAEMVHIAHSEGHCVMAHGNGPANVLAAAKAEVDSIEHGAYLNDEALAAMKEAGTVWVPTVSTVANLRGKGRFEEAAVQEIYACARENLRKFAALGGLIAVGSDAGAWAVPHGCESEEQLLRLDVPAEILAKGNAKIMEKF